MDIVKYTVFAVVIETLSDGGRHPEIVQRPITGSVQL
jgi:hypothetical protein